MTNKLAIIEVKITLPSSFKPRTMTYRGFSQMEKISEKDFVAKRAEDLFVEHVVGKGVNFNLKKEDLKVKTSVTVYHAHCYIPTENQVKLKFEKSHE